MYKIWNNFKTTLLLSLLMGLCLAVGYLLGGRSALFPAFMIGAGLAGTGRGLARALQKLEMASKRIPLRVPDAQSNMFIVAPLTGSEMAKLFRTHPPTEERIARLLDM